MGKHKWCELNIMSVAYTNYIVRLFNMVIFFQIWNKTLLNTHREWPLRNAFLDWVFCLIVVEDFHKPKAIFWTLAGGDS